MIKKMVKMEDKELLRRFQTALDMENWVVSLYTNDINRVDDPETRAMFAHQSEESARHALEVRKMMDTLRIKQKVDNPLDLPGALRLANTGLQEERGMLRFYSYMIKNVNDADLKKFFTRLAKEEMLHIKQVEGLIKSLTKRIGKK